MLRLVASASVAGAVHNFNSQTPVNDYCQRKAARSNCLMHFFVRLLLLVMVAISPSNVVTLSVHAAAFGIFEGHTDIGAPHLRGSVENGPATSDFMVSGGGENMWFTNDALHFVWKKVSGDVSLTSEIAFLI